MLRHKLFLLFLLIFIFLIGCDNNDNNNDSISAKKFLFDHPNIKLRLNKDQFTFDKYSSTKDFDLFFRKCDGEVLTVYITDGSRNEYDELLYTPYEILLNRNPQRIGNTNFMVWTS
jgi:hypothetical protein